MSSLFAKRLTFTPLYRLLDHARANNLRQLLVDLQTLLNDVRAGRQHNVAGMLRPILDTNGMSPVPDPVYGMQIPLEMRRRWRLRGIDPDSDNEVFELLARTDPRYSEPYDLNEEHFHKRARVCA